MESHRSPNPTSMKSIRQRNIIASATRIIPSCFSDPCVRCSFFSAASAKNRLRQRAISALTILPGHSVLSVDREDHGRTAASGSQWSEE